MEYIYGQSSNDGPPIPDIILEEYDKYFYKICWKSNKAGVIDTDPGLVTKADLAKLYPRVVQAWDAKLRAERAEADQIEQNFMRFCWQFYGRLPDGTKFVEKRHRGVACDQSLRPGMRQHWGELEKCEIHPSTRPSAYVCKGCRVSHYEQASTAFDRGLIMARGARVPVCRDCVREASKSGGNRDCVCDTKWSCFRCREAELEKLAEAREEHVEGRCGKCGQRCILVELVGICLHCQGWVMYAAADEDLWEEDENESIGDGEKE